MSRRRALAVLGTVPFAGAAILAQQPPAQQGPPKQTHEGPNQPARDTRLPQPAQPTWRFFNLRERRTARALADDIIPKDERSGSASEAGVVEFMDFNLSVPETSNDVRIAFRGGLRWIDTESRRRFGVAYHLATAAQRHQILDDIAYPDRATPAMRYGAAFFPRFRDMVAGGFFSSAIGYKDLQYIGNTFNPSWQGCPEPALRKLGVSYALMDTIIKPEGK
jgi:hypothetical protein